MRNKLIIPIAFGLLTGSCHEPTPFLSEEPVVREVCHEAVILNCTRTSPTNYERALTTMRQSIGCPTPRAAEAFFSHNRSCGAFLSVRTHNGFYGRTEFFVSDGCLIGEITETDAVPLQGCFNRSRGLIPDCRPWVSLPLC